MTDPRCPTCGFIHGCNCGNAEEAGRVEELASRLEQASWYKRANGDDTLMKDAAALLREQERKLEEARRERDEWEGYEACAKCTRRARAAEARVEVLEAALREIRACVGPGVGITTDGERVTITDYIDHALSPQPEETLQDMQNRATRELIEKRRKDAPDPDVRPGGKHAGDPWCDPSAR